MSDTKLNYIQIGDQTYNIGGSGGSVGGYPVVTIEDDFNIEAEPNTFYNIKNNADSEISINFKDGYSIEGSTISDRESTIEIEPNVSLPSSDIANEFVFNINSPANIIFNKEIKWNNDNIPDLTGEGVCTISIVNGVGCYTFVNN